MKWLEKLKSGLYNTSSKITQSVRVFVSGKKIDLESLNELEDSLLMTDMGVKTAQDIISYIKNKKFIEPTEDDIKNAIKEIIISKITGLEKNIFLTSEKKIKTLLFCGVNGSGKTTSIGKIANQFTNEGKKVLIAACDTFRAAAVEQLEVWTKRAGADFFVGSHNQDPASVAYTAYEKAINEQYDILIIDTAGRLQNNENLMEELAKIDRVIKKINSSAPDETLIVIDATIGQNSLAQVEKFNKYIKVSGLIITKLDGTAKAGIVLNISEKFKLPICLIGIGEKIDDLSIFRAKDFADNLLAQD